MSSEENPPNEIESNSDGEPLNATPETGSPQAIGESNAENAAQLEQDPPMAELAHVEAVEVAEASLEGSIVTPSGFALASQPPLARNLENMSAKGGAIGAVVLGLWCVAGSFVTNWSIINGILGILLGVWGLTSRNKRMAWFGLTLCLIGVFLSLIQVSELVNEYLNEVEEFPS